MRVLAFQKKLDEAERRGQARAVAGVQAAARRRVVQPITQASVATRHLSGVGAVRLVRRFVGRGKGSAAAGAGARVGAGAVAVPARASSYMVGAGSELLLGSAMIDVEAIAAKGAASGAEAGGEGGEAGAEGGLLHEASFREFVRWTMLTVHDRKKEGAPLTVTAFAEAHGLTVPRLTQWRRAPIFERVRAYLLEQWAKDSVPVLFRAALVRGAMGKGATGAPDRKLLLEMTGAYTKKHRIEVSGEVSVEHSAAPVSQSEGDLHDAALAHLRLSQPGRSDGELRGLLDAVLALAAAEGGAPRVPMPARLHATPHPEDAVLVPDDARGAEGSAARGDGGAP